MVGQTECTNEPTNERRNVDDDDKEVKVMELQANACELKSAHMQYRIPNTNS